MRNIILLFVLVLGMSACTSQSAINLEKRKITALYELSVADIIYDINSDGTIFIDVTKLHFVSPEHYGYRSAQIELIINNFNTDIQSERPLE